MESPSVTHQRILMELYVQINLHIKKNKGPCEVFLPFEVYIAGNILNYAEPDLSIICKPDMMLLLLCKKQEIDFFVSLC